jgi:hypothetical protein
MSHRIRRLSIKFTVQKDVTSPDSANRCKIRNWTVTPLFRAEQCPTVKTETPKGTFLEKEQYRIMIIVSHKVTATRQWLIQVQQSTNCPQLTHMSLGMLYANNIISKPVMWFSFANRFIASIFRSHKVCVVSAQSCKSPRLPHITPIHLVNKLLKKSGKSDVKIYIILYIV